MRHCDGGKVDLKFGPIWRMQNSDGGDGGDGGDDGHDEYGGKQYGGK